MARPRNPKLLEIYNRMLAAAADQTSELWYHAKPHRGASHRCAFWDGYLGKRSTLNIPGTLTSACYRAGQHFAKTNPGIKDADRIGVSRRWFQKPGHARRHYDIALGKRALAVAAGAVEITQRQCAAMTGIRRLTGKLGAPEGAVEAYLAMLEGRR